MLATRGESRPTGDAHATASEAYVPLKMGNNATTCSGSETESPRIIQSNQGSDTPEAPAEMALGESDTHLPHLPRTMSDIDDFDPFQVFEVEHRPCMLLHVCVESGERISKGWMADLLDTPDPYVVLQVRTAVDGKKRTSTIDNDVNPRWNSNFTFHLDSNFKNQLEVELWDANFTMDENLGRTTVALHELTLGKTQKRTLLFNAGSKVHIRLLVEFDSNPTLRYSLALSDQEKSFRKKRRAIVMKSMQRMFPKDGPASMSEVPNIGMLGSGGGFRAMVGMSGVMTALSDCGILDLLMYTGTLSGSSWYVSQLYSHPRWPDMRPGEQRSQLRENIDSSLLWLLKPSSLYRYLDRILQKRRLGQPVSFTDFFGHLVGETLLKNCLDSRLTDQRAKIAGAVVPMPLYTCVHVKKDVSAQVFQEWVEFSPYEIGIPKYGTFMPTELFASKFFLGKLVKKFQEPPLHYLQGIWGSAFCILFKRLINDSEKVEDPVEVLRQRHKVQLEECRRSGTRHSGCESTDDIRLEMERELCDGMGNISETESSESSEIYDSDTGHDEDVDETTVRTDENRKNSSTSSGASRKKCTRQSGFWKNFLESMVSSSKFSLLSTRQGRAGVIHNPLRGLSLHKLYPISPFTPAPALTNSLPNDQFRSMFDLHPTSEKHLYMVDAGLTFNSPFPLLLRPQRGIDLILSFDFSARPSDEHHPFKEILLAEKWAKLNCVAFPPIDVKQFDGQPTRELYVFKHPDPAQHCPIVLHFVLVNRDFRHFKYPGRPRETKEELEFADFTLFDDPKTPYSTFNFKYSHQAFERLSRLTEFNTTKHVGDIKQAVLQCIANRREVGPRPAIALEAIQRMELPAAKKWQLHRYSTPLSMNAPKRPTRICAVGERSDATSGNATVVVSDSMSKQTPVVVNKKRKLAPEESAKKKKISRKIKRTIKDADGSDDSDLAGPSVRFRLTDK